MISEFELAETQAVIFDFDGVFTDNGVYVDESGLETVRCCRSDGIGLERLRELGVHVFIVSTETNPVVKARATKMRIECFYGVTNKATVIEDICRNISVPLCSVMFVGNDVNDIPAFRVVGQPVAVADAHSDIKSFVRMSTTKEGGRGAVREICDLIFRAKTAQINQRNS